MKKHLKLSFLAIFATLLLNSCGSSFGSQTVLTPKEASKVFDVNNATKDELYVRANNWMVERFTSAKSVLQFSDKEQGVISGKFLLNSIILGKSSNYGPLVYEDVYAIIKIQLKDNKVKITVKPKPYKNAFNSFAGGKSYPVESVEQDMQSLISSFQTAMKSEQEDF